MCIRKLIENPGIEVSQKLTKWQCKYIGECPGAIEHYVKLGSACQTEEACNCGAELLSHFFLHMPQ